MTDRARDALRLVEMTPDFTRAPLASLLICCGETRVMCTASVEERVPPFRMDSGGGWLTGEDSMLPGTTPSRVRRAVTRGKQDGRATEIQRLIGRSLRAGFDLDAIGPRTLWIDCDVLQADGGTRTAAITGGYAVARIAIERLINSGKANKAALLEPVAAVSVGLVDGKPSLDLDYAWDSRADVDMNVVMDGAGQLIEVQGTGERTTFSRAQLNTLLDLADKGVETLLARQRDAVAAALAARPTA